MHSGEICRKMLRDGAAERQHGPIVSVPLIPQRAAAIGFISHSGSPVERRPTVPVSGVEKVEPFAHEIGPGISVECFSVSFSKNIDPLDGRFLGQVGIDRKRRGREEVLLGLAMMIRKDLWMPLKKSFGGG